ncbi:unnamed protein product [Prorocentrum cordatum]|uniref:Uncharacterized protein n=1 Tax=Prorocentrum cordatum TaxID=2364126 RepID=A0ABN9YCS6_9DINO|nr:unnamed protein product [Polarella glacialis]
MEKRISTHRSLHSDSTQLQALELELSVLQFMHVHAYPAKKRAANQRAYVQRAEKSLEAAEQEEKLTAAALRAASTHHKTLAEDLQQAKSALSQFDEMAEQEIKSAAFAEAAESEFKHVRPNPFMPAVFAELQASQLTLAAQMKMLTDFLVEVKSSISTLAMHQSGPATAEPPLETAASAAPAAAKSAASRAKPMAQRRQEAWQRAVANLPGQVKLVAALTSSSAAPAGAPEDADSDTEPPHESLCLPRDPEATTAQVAGDDSDDTMKDATARGDGLAAEEASVR